MSMRSDKMVVIIMYTILTAFTIVCLIPFVIALSVSFSTEAQISLKGYSLLPRAFTLDTYRFMFQSRSSELLRGYATSFLVTAAGTVCAVLITTAYAYVISVKGFKYRNVFSFFAYFTMLFNGGMLPWFILATKYYHLSDSYAGLFVPYLMNVFLMYLQVNYFRSIPHEIVESAEVDGAGYMRIFFVIMLPLAQVGLVTISLFYALQFWNDFYLPLMLINKESMFTIQFLMYKMMSNIQYLASGINHQLSGANVAPPLETSKMAMTCLTIAPIALIYPFMQRFFVKGIVVGSVKG
jgi:putative aldouronate transport system permease protein